MGATYWSRCDIGISPGSHLQMCKYPETTAWTAFSSFTCEIKVNGVVAAAKPLHDRREHHVMIGGLLPPKLVRYSDSILLILLKLVDSSLALNQLLVTIQRIQDVLKFGLEVLPDRLEKLFPY
jgi:hypothetical protein